MKETINVSISGIAFILDRECYAMLSNYLNQTEASLKNDPSAREIIAEIEARIAEEILSAQSADHPISMGVIRPIIERLGGTVSNGSDYQPIAKPLTKRLYRNPEGSILGGVCSGLATYFNTSVALFRILFVLPIFLPALSLLWWHHAFIWPSQSFSGTSMLVYIIMWIVIPRARSPRQKLEMQGENITAHSIAQEQSTQQVTKNGSEISNVVVSILKIAALSFGILLFTGAVIGLVVGLSALSLNIHRFATPIPEALRILDISYFWASMIVSGIILIPIITILYQIFNVTIGLRKSKIVTSILILAWFALVIYAFVLILSNISELAIMDWSWERIGNHHLRIYWENR